MAKFRVVKFGAAYYVEKRLLPFIWWPMGFAFSEEEAFRRIDSGYYDDVVIKRKGGRP